MAPPTYGQAFYLDGVTIYAHSQATTIALTDIVTMSGAVTISGALTVSGAISLSGAITTTTTISSTVTVATVALGTVRAIYGKGVASAEDIASGNLVGVRGEITLSGTITAGGCYLNGAQGKLITGSSAVMNHEDSRLCGMLAQLDISTGTFTTGQLSGLWVDMGGSASASAISTKGGGQCNILRLQNTTGMTVNSFIYGHSLADYVMDLSAPGGSMSWLATSAGSAATKYLKILVGGTIYKIDLLADS